MTCKHLCLPWKKPPSPISTGLGILKKQTQNLFLWVTELSCKLNSWTQELFTIKVGALIGKDYHPKIWNGDMWEDYHEAGHIEPLNFYESSLPVEASSPPPSEINPEAVAMQGNADSPQGWPPPLLFATRLTTRLKATKGEVQSMTHEEVHHTPKELFEFSNLYKIPGNMCGNRY